MIENGLILNVVVLIRLTALTVLGEEMFVAGLVRRRPKGQRERERERERCFNNSIIGLINLYHTDIYKLLASWRLIFKEKERPYLWSITLGLILEAQVPVHWKISIGSLEQL